MLEFFLAELESLFKSPNNPWHLPSFQVLSDMKESMLVRTTLEALVNMKESMLVRTTFEALVNVKESMYVDENNNMKGQQH